MELVIYIIFNIKKKIYNNYKYYNINNINKIFE